MKMMQPRQLIKYLITVTYATFVSLILLQPGLASESLQLPSREELSLNGTWGFSPEGGEATTIVVPEAWDAQPGFACTQATYQRTVTIPDDWTGKIIKVEFEAVNYLADVYVNDQLAGSHVGGWVPFAIDITKFLNGAKEFTLKVAVKGGRHPPIFEQGKGVQWPVGWFGHQQQWGIISDTWFAMAVVDDVFIQTSHQDRRIIADYTITNTTAQPRTVTIAAEAQLATRALADSGAGKISEVNHALTPTTITVPAQTSIAVRLSDEWHDPLLWNPGTPHLYHLITTIRAGNDPDDHDTTAKLSILAGNVSAFVKSPSKAINIISMAFA